MRTIIIIVFSIGFSLNLSSQEVNKRTLNSFYFHTIEDYFSKIESKSESNKFYIQTDKSVDLSQTEFENFSIHFVNVNEAKVLIRKNRISELYWIKIGTISKDTIDVLIGGWAVDYKRKFFKGNYIYSAWCGGSDGNIPHGRFIYNYESKNWDFISQKVMLDDQILEYQKKLKE